MKPQSKPFRSPFLRFTMGWMFIVSIPAIPLCWAKLGNEMLLSAIIFFFLMLAYQVGEYFYDEYHYRHRKLNGRKHPAGDRGNQNILNS